LNLAGRGAPPARIPDGVERIAIIKLDLDPPTPVVRPAPSAASK